MTTPSTVPTIDPALTKKTNALRLVEILDRGTPEEVSAALKAMLLLNRPELAAYATAVDIVFARLGGGGRISRVLGRIPFIGGLFR